MRICLILILSSIFAGCGSDTETPSAPQAAFGDSADVTIFAKWNRPLGDASIFADSGRYGGFPVAENFAPNFSDLSNLSLGRNSFFEATEKVCRIVEMMGIGPIEQCQQDSLDGAIVIEGDFKTGIVTYSMTAKVCLFADENRLDCRSGSRAAYYSYQIDTEGILHWCAYGNFSDQSEMRTPLYCYDGELFR